MSAASTRKGQFKQSPTNLRIKLLEEIFSRLGIAYDNLPDYRTIHYDSAIGLVRNGKYHNLVDLSYIYDTVIETCRLATPKLERNKPIPKEQVAVLAKEANAFLVGIPYQYEVFMPILKDSGVVLSRQMNKQVRLVTVDATEANRYKAANPDPEPDDGPALTTNSLRRLLGDLLKEQIPVPSEGQSYLAVKVTGYAQSGTLTVFEADPMYLYKVFFALAFATGNLQKKNVTASQAYNAQPQFSFYAYKKNYEFATTLNRPADDAKLINAHEVAAQESDLDNFITTFQLLFSEQSDSLVEKLRVQIINSLYWYFETLKTESHNLKTVFFTSVLDSFFVTGQSKEVKAATIAHETTKSVQAEELITKEIIALYDERNHIIHSEMPLFDYGAKDKQRLAASRARVEVSITQAYNKFLTSCFHRYIESVQL